MGHVDDAHLAEDDGEPQRHQHVDRKQDQAGEALHCENGAEIAKRIVTEHDPFSVVGKSRVANEFATRGS